MNEITECCNHAPLYYIWKEPDGSLGYEPWDFCPSCLESCSLYSPEKRKEQIRLQEILLSDEERRDSIARAMEKTKRENELLNDDVDIKTDSICVCGKQKCA